MTYYVTCTDTFLSGWGKAKGKTNKLIFVCDTAEEQKIVANNCEARTDMVNVILHSSIPFGLTALTKDTYIRALEYIQVKTREECAAFYRKDFFPRNISI